MLFRSDTSQSGIDYMADHTKFKDGSITSIKNAIQIGNTNQYFAVVDDATQNLKIYVYGEGGFASTISVNNKKVNADHDEAHKHPKNFDVQTVTLNENDKMVTVPINITADNNKSMSYLLTIYKKKAATAIKEITATSKGVANGKTYREIGRAHV